MNAHEAAIPAINDRGRRFRVPPISVAIPTRARPHYLQICLESLVSQTMPPSEVIVSEDGHDEETEALVAEFQGRGVPIRHLRNHAPLGQLDNRRHALQMTSCELVAMLDDDDRWEPTFLERTAQALVAHPECGFASTDQLMINEDGQILPDETERASRTYGRTRMSTGVYEDVLRRELRERSFPLDATLFRRSVVQEIGFFPAYGGTAPDVALFLEIGARRVACYYIAERLGAYRIHNGQQSVLYAANMAALVNVLVSWRPGSLDSDERRLHSAQYRSAIVELAVARAHECDRSGALSALGGYFAFGWGSSSPQRLLVLAVLLIFKRHSAAPRRG